MGITKTSFGKEAKDKLKNGVETISKAVSVTMGPFGKNVLYKNDYGGIQSTKDGVSVAKMVKELEDPIEDFGAQIIKQAAIKTVEQAGDGTTTSTVLASFIAKASIDAASLPGVNVTEIKRGIEDATNIIVNTLKEKSLNIKDTKQLKQIAALSANGSSEIADLVTTSLDKVGRDGVVTVEESRTGETSLEVVEGIQFDRGYKSPYFVTNNNSMQCELKDSLILLYDKRLSNSKELLPILNSVSQQNKSLTIIAEDIADEILSLLIVNKMRGTLKVVAIKAPDFGEKRTLILEDIAAITGGTLISPDKGMKLDKFNTDWFGEARVVTVGKDTTTIVDGKGDEETIKARIEEVKNQLANTTSAYEIEKLQERIAKMIGGVAIINVGGRNEIEIKEKKDRVEDALNATKAAIEEGILPGAGIALLHARKELKPLEKTDFSTGHSIMFMACAKPFKQILENAGLNHEDYIRFNSLSSDLVPDLLGRGGEVNAYLHGVLDPTKVVRCALQNAVSAAITLLLTECVIVEKEDKKENLSENLM